MPDLIADSKSLSSVCPLLLYNESVEQCFTPDLIADMLLTGCCVFENCRRVGPGKKCCVLCAL